MNETITTISTRITSFAAANVDVLVVRTLFSSQVNATLRSRHSFAELVLTLTVFFSLVGVWCFAAYSLTRQPAVAHTLRRYSNSLVPYLLVGLGIFIFWGSFPLALLSIAAIYFCMRSIVRIKTRSPEIKVS